MIASPHLAGLDRYERSMGGWVDNTHDGAFTHTVHLADDDAGVELVAVCTPRRATRCARAWRGFSSS